MSSSPSLSRLPHELVLDIFEYLPERRDVAALNSISVRFYQVWRSNAAAISDVILSRTIDCYASAKELVRLQRAQERKRGDDDDGSEAGDAYREVLRRNNRFADNAFLISRECRVLLLPSHIGDEGCHEHLRLRYRIHCIAALSSDKAAQVRYVGATSLDDLRRMRRDKIWSNPRIYYTISEYFHIYIRTVLARDPFELIDLAYVAIGAMEISG